MTCSYYVPLHFSLVLFMSLPGIACIQLALHLSQSCCDPAGIVVFSWCYYILGVGVGVVGLLVACSGFCLKLQIGVT